jgi:predicted amidohydrolase
MRVGYVQMHPVFGQPERNLQKVHQLIEGTDADLLVLPELFNTGYIFTSIEELKSFAEDPDDSFTIKTLIELSRMKGTYIVAGFAEKAGENCYNSSILLGPEGIIGLYRKLHLFKDEKKWFKRGNSPPPVYQISGINVGLMICFDWIFPETTRILALKGADIICHSTNLVLPWCQKATIIRSIENGVFIILSNRIGTESRGGDKMTFTGKSQVVDPQGNVLVSSLEDNEDVMVVEIDPIQARNKQITEANNLIQDRRDDVYSLRYQ